MMPRIFWNDIIHLGEVLEIAGEQGHHFARVLRSRVGEPVVVASKDGPFLAEIIAVDNKIGQISVTIQNPYPSHEAKRQVLVIQGIAKGDKMDTIVQKCTEVGVSALIVYAAKRSVVQLDKKSTQKVERWQKIAAEAAGQAQRDVIPKLSYADSLSQLVSHLESVSIGAVLFLDEAEEALGLKSALARVPADDGKPIVIMVGPEGGWDDVEREQFQSQLGAIPVTLGPRILRTETAGVVAAGAIFYEYGELGG